MKIKDFLARYGNVIAMVAWCLLWAAALVKTNHAIESAYIAVGVIGGWLWMFLFGCKMFNFGMPYSNDALSEVGE